ncbi:class I SAM-dependent methyltransferase [Staphylococcus saprophyticus]|nr:class I SAM-dependent methyltransferase [Staphylococcus saprophyticus]
MNDESFDMVICGNVRWVVGNRKGAYEEWLGVLKGKGKVINIDGNYGKD